MIYKNKKGPPIRFNQLNPFSNSWRLLTLAAFAIVANPVYGQSDSAKTDSTFDIRSILGEHDDRGGLTLTSGKAYNRVEGLPIMIGPSFRGYARGAVLRLSILGIIRTAHSMHWDSENLGHRITAEARFGGHLGYSAGATSFDVVTPVERWQMPEPDAGLSAFLFKRDYLDYYGTHGARVFASAYAGEAARISVEYGHERWSSRSERDVTTLFRGARGWRINPLTDDGVMHIFETHLLLDSRNAELNPWAGWFLDGRYEYGAGKLIRRDTGPVLRPVGFDGDHVNYGRAFFDIRKYNRISPMIQLNARLVLGGWLHGDRLPLERRVSVGGPGTIPGFDFRRVEIGPDVGQCAENFELPGRPARCDRVILAQVEYRNELHSDLIDVFNRNGLRLRGAEFNVRPSIVAFADAGRGWNVGTREGDLTYPSGSIPFDKYRTDVGLGLDLGVAGIYVAKAVSTPKEPANFFVRIHNRF